MGFVSKVAAHLSDPRAPSPARGGLLIMERNALAADSSFKEHFQTEILDLFSYFSDKTSSLKGSSIATSHVC